MASTDQGEGSGDQTDRINVTLPGGTYNGIYIPAVTVSGDNVYKSSTSDLLKTKPGEAGAKTDWDASTLDGAIAWLTAHADYLKRMYHGMDDIKKLMDGPKPTQDVMQHSGVDGQSGGPLGGFEWARKLADRHNNLFPGFNTTLKTVVQDLYDAADALKKVKEKYQDVEHANAMSAADMEADFDDAGSQSHNI